MPSYSAWIQNTRIRTAAESIQNGLQMARAEAVKRNVSVQFVLSDGAAWLIGCETVNSTCPADIQSRTVGEGSSSDIIVETDAGYTVVFNNLGAVNTSPAPFSQVDIDSSVASADRPLRITIGVGGNIRMCDPSPTLSSTDPRKC
jgi:type IV fimbrial biogenesis protein FimT